MVLTEHMGDVMGLAKYKWVAITRVRNVYPESWNNAITDYEIYSALRFRNVECVKTEFGTTAKYVSFTFGSSKPNFIVHVKLIPADCDRI